MAQSMVYYRADACDDEQFLKLGSNLQSRHVNLIVTRDTSQLKPNEKTIEVQCDDHNWGYWRQEMNKASLKSNPNGLFEHRLLWLSCYMVTEVSIIDCIQNMKSNGTKEVA
jgi:hypothetical protein